MDKAIVIISTRQLAQVNFMDKFLNDFDLILIASEEEQKNLPQNISKFFSSKFSVNIKNTDGVIVEYVQDEIIDFISSIKNNYIEVSFVCFDEGNVVIADSLRNGDKSDTSLEQFRDKILMKKLLKNKNIRTPLFIENLEDSLIYNELSTTIGVPFVIKPRNSAGSNNVYIVRNESEFLSAKNAIGSMINDYEAEQFIEGDLYHCDIALWQNELIFSECTKYLSPTIDFQAGTPLGGYIMDQNDPLRDQLIVFAKDTLTALEAKDGVYHMEIFVQDSEEKQLIFLEVGARPPGMLVTSMYEKATGVNLLNLDILIRTGSVPANFSFSRQKYAFYLVYPKGKGCVESLTTPKLNENIEVKFLCDTTIGEKHEGCFSNLDHCAHILCSSIEKSLIKNAYMQLSSFKPVNYST